MKTFGLFVTIALVIPLAACERRDQCDSGGWCDGTTPVYACYRDRDCPPNNYCDQHGVCVPLGPIPPGRGAGGSGGTGAGGIARTPAAFPARDGGVDLGLGGPGVGGAPGTGGHAQGDAGISSTGGSGAGGHATATGRGDRAGRNDRASHRRRPHLRHGRRPELPPPHDAGLPVRPRLRPDRPLRRR